MTRRESILGSVCLHWQSSYRGVPATVCCTTRLAPRRVHSPIAVKGE
jgi:hypothetical protein